MADFCSIDLRVEHGEYRERRNTHTYSGVDPGGG